MNKLLPCLKLLCLILLLGATGCGFKMRGAVTLPENLQTMMLLPNNPYDSLQLALKQTLKLNGIEVVEPGNDQRKVSKLTIIGQEFSERTTAYSSDGQASQSLMKFKITYQLTDPTGKVIIEQQVAEVERELLTAPGAVLVTESESEHLRSDMTREAALQLVRQLSVLP